MERIWTCKIGGQVGDIPGGADLPMREAIERAFIEVTGASPEFIFSGWGAELDEAERVSDRSGA